MNPSNADDVGGAVPAGAPTTAPSSGSTLDARGPLAIVRQEHRSLATLMNGVKFIVRRAREPRRLPDFALLHAVLLYLEEYSLEYHHPKEESFLFARLRERAPEWSPLLDQLCVEHDADGEQLANLRDSLHLWANGAPEGIERFSSKFEQFADSQWRHIGAEEHLLLPAAERHLTAGDWEVIERGFDRLCAPAIDVGVEESFADFSMRLVNLAPQLLLARDAKDSPRNTSPTPAPFS